MPATGSAQMKRTVTGVLFQPLAFGGGANRAEMFGAPLSMRIGSLAVVARLPALSVTVSLTVVMPAAGVTMSAGHESTPDAGSTQVKCAVTGPVNHPFPFGPGDSVAMITGGA